MGLLYTTTNVPMSRPNDASANESRALIERPYSCLPRTVGAVYDRAGFLCKTRIAVEETLSVVIEFEVIGLDLPLA